MKRIIAAIAALCLLALPACADSLGSAVGGTAANQSSLSGGIYNATPPTLSDGQQAGLQTDINGKLNVNATTSISGFPGVQTTGTAIAVTTGGVTGTLPAGSVVVASNVGTTNVAYCKLGASATTSDQLIAPQSWFAFTVGASTQLTCITSTSTTTVNMVGGSGIPTGAGGGSGSGSGGAVTNAGTFAVQLTGVTNNINNVAGTVSLPTGASTSALQPSNSAQGATTSGQTGTLVMGAVTTAAPTYTNAQSSPLSLDAGGSVRVNVTSATGVAQGSTTSGQTVSPIGCRTLTSAPTDTTAQTNMPWCRTNGTLAQDLVSINGTTVSTGTGAQGSGTPRVAVATDTATIAGSAPGTAGSASAQVVTVQGVASMTPVLAQVVPGTANGLTFATLTAANSTNATNLKASAGQLYHVTAFNNSATLAWISFYNTAGTPTCGTAIVYQVMIPANSTSGAGAIDDIPSGLVFSTGIGYCITTGIAGTGSVAASAYVANFGYK